jgi:hypothetical protein
MARGSIPVTKSTRLGATLPAETNGDPANDHQFANDGNTRLLVRNSSVDTAYDVIVFVERQVDGLPKGSRTVEVPFGETVSFGPYPVKDYGRLVLVDVENAALKLRCLK